MKHFVAVILSFMGLLMLFVGGQGDAAPSEAVVIQQVQVRSVLDSGSEVVIIYNSSDQDIDVSGWCIQYASYVSDSFRTKGCIEPPDDLTKVLLSAGGFASFTTEDFILENEDFVADVTFSSGFANSSGHVRIIDASDKEIDRLGWGSALYPEGEPAQVHSVGEVMSRNFDLDIIDTDNNSVDFSSQTIMPEVVSGLHEAPFAVDICPNIDGEHFELPTGYLQDDTGDCWQDFCPNIEGLQIVAPVGTYRPAEDCVEEPVDLCINIEGIQITMPDDFMLDEDNFCVQDVCPTIDGLQAEIPEGYMIDDQFVCVLEPLEDAVLHVTELYANPPSFDTGQEFIEIYNPHDQPINLKGYTLSLGPNFTKMYVFEDGAIEAKSYRMLGDTQSSLILPNSTGVAVRLTAPAGNVVDETDIYSDAAVDTSWAFIEDVWVYTNQITPEAANKPDLAPSTTDADRNFAEDDEEIVYSPCPEGKLRNPLTNRCKLIESTVSSLVPCDTNEYRNPTTNRCNKIQTATSSLTPCSAGQYRNPQTNRCRNSATTTSSLTPCAAGQFRNPQTNRCKKIETSTASALKPCGEGQERNPDTNRCRKVQSVLGLSSADELPVVEDVHVPLTQAAKNWIAPIGAFSAALVYIGYEWRREIMRRVAAISVFRR